MICHWSPLGGSEGTQQTIRNTQQHIFLAQHLAHPPANYLTGTRKASVLSSLYWHNNSSNYTYRHFRGVKYRQAHNRHEPQTPNSTNDSSRLNRGCALPVMLEPSLVAGDAEGGTREQPGILARSHSLPRTHGRGPNSTDAASLNWDTNGSYVQTIILTL